MLKAFKQYISVKLNPAQPAIVVDNRTASPANITDYKDAYAEIEIVYRCLDVIVNACVEIPFLVEADNPRPPTDRINKLLNYYPNPFEDRIKLFRKAYLDLYLDGNAFFYYDAENSKLYGVTKSTISNVRRNKTWEDVNAKSI